MAETESIEGSGWPLGFKSAPGDRRSGGCRRRDLFATASPPMNHFQKEAPVVRVNHNGAALDAAEAAA